MDPMSQVPKNKGHGVVLTLSLVKGDDELSERSVFVWENEPVVVGRCSTNRTKDMVPRTSNLYLTNSVVSRNHASFSYKRIANKRDVEHKIYIEDTGSSHGTYINGKSLDKGKPRVLEELDEVTFGIGIIRHDAEFSPPTFQVRINRSKFHESEAPDYSSSPNLTGRSYSVPEGTSSDVYDSEEEEDMQIEDESDEDDDEEDDSYQPEGDFDVEADPGDVYERNHYDLRQESESIDPAAAITSSQYPEDDAETHWNSADNLDSFGEPSSQFRDVEGDVTADLTISGWATNVVNGHEAPAAAKVVEPETADQQRRDTFWKVVSANSQPEESEPSTKKTMADGYGSGILPIKDLLNHNAATPEPQASRKRDFSAMEAESLSLAKVVDARADTEAAKILTTALDVVLETAPADSLKEPLEASLTSAVQSANAAPVAQPPAKRQRLREVAAATGWFLAGAVSTVVALGSLPEGYFA